MPDVVDLRSDTVTQPSRAMREAMVAAPVGDDVYGEDPTVLALERRVAEMFGHEAALFCPTGSMANLLGVRALVPPGQEVLCDDQAHIVRAEMGAHGAVHGVTTRTFPSPQGRLEVEQVARLLSPNAGPHLVSTAAVAVENTHNFAGGTVQDLDQIKAVAALCREHEIGLHLDGARLWNAHVATGTPLLEFGQLFDTISVCFSKGLGAPVGSALIGSADRVGQARVWRKRLGGGWRQAGLLAAGALHALDHHIDRLADDHANARRFAAAVAEHRPGAVDPASVQTNPESARTDPASARTDPASARTDPESARTDSASLRTNIVVLDTGDVSARDIALAAAEQQVLVSALGSRVLRAVTHLDVDGDGCERAGEIIGRLLHRA